MAPVSDHWVVLALIHLTLAGWQSRRAKKQRQVALVEQFAVRDRVVRLQP